MVGDSTTLHPQSIISVSPGSASTSCEALSEASSDLPQFPCHHGRRSPGSLEDLRADYCTKRLLFPGSTGKASTHESRPGLGDALWLKPLLCMQEDQSSGFQTQEHAGGHVTFL